MITHDDLAKKIDVLEVNQERFLVEYGKSTGLKFEILEKIETTLERFEDRLVAIEGKISTYDSWVQRAKGARTVLIGTAIAIWWLIHDKVETFFGVKK